FTVTTTATGTTPVANIFAVSGKVIGDCPSMGTASAAPTSSTEATINWTLSSVGDGATAATTYTVELYSDSAYTTPVAGFPSTGITNTSLSVTGLTFGSTYYYKVKANNGNCDSGYVTGSFTMQYCTPTTTYTGSYYVNNFTTTSVFGTNISNATGYTAAYNNYSAQGVTVASGNSFGFSLGVQSYTYAEVWVDWNGDLDFDDSGELMSSFTTYGTSSPTTFTGSITVPSTAAIGSYRLRVRSRYYYNTTASSCGNLNYGETEDYTINVIAPPTCFTPTAISATFNSTTGTFSWTAPTSGTTPEGYEYVITTTAGTPTGSGTTTTTNSFTTTVSLNTTYYVYVRSSCGGGDYSVWNNASFYTGYCTPSSSSTTYYITGFSTTGGVTNITNTGTGQSTSGYGDYTAQSVSNYAGTTINFSASFSTGTYGLAIWVDWNNDYDFSDSGEQRFVSSGYNGSYSSSFTIPAGTAPGNYRMRVFADYYSTAPSNPCAFSTSGPYGEAEDYTLTVTPDLSCMYPSNLAATPGLTSATLSWTAPTSAPSDGYQYYVSTSSTAPTSGTTPSGSVGAGITTVNVTGLTTETTYYYWVRSNCGSETSPWTGGSSFYTTYCTPTYSNCDSTHRITAV
ncbi:GEVED domain-containing protein, partial [Flavobacterium sp. RHBU_3]|uniref:GEVED domain-containing protein n=1 Tax=Flavobacterium sp. RHBU_3 TaxID=3391184 RepID=UPI003984F474